MSEELLPCPFCGEEAVHDTGISPLESVDWAWCNNPECPLHGELLFTVEQWNTRPHSNPYRYEEYADFAGQSPDVSKVGMGAFVIYDMAK